MKIRHQVNDFAKLNITAFMVYTLKIAISKNEQIPCTLSIKVMGTLIGTIVQLLGGLGAANAELQKKEFITGGTMKLPKFSLHLC